MPLCHKGLRYNSSILFAGKSKRYKMTELGELVRQGTCCPVSFDVGFSENQSVGGLSSEKEALRLCPTVIT